MVMEIKPTTGRETAGQHKEIPEVGGLPLQDPQKPPSQPYTRSTGTQSRRQTYRETGDSRRRQRQTLQLRKGHITHSLQHAHRLQNTEIAARPRYTSKCVTSFPHAGHHCHTTVSSQHTSRKQVACDAAHLYKAMIRPHFHSTQLDIMKAACPPHNQGVPTASWSKHMCDTGGPCRVRRLSSVLPGPTLQHRPGGGDWEWEPFQVTGPPTSPPSGTPPATVSRCSHRQARLAMQTHVPAQVTPCARANRHHGNRTSQPHQPSSWQLDQPATPTEGSEELTPDAACHCSSMEQCQDERAEEMRDPHEKIIQSVASSSTIPTCENPRPTPLGIKPSSPMWELLILVLHKEWAALLPPDKVCLHECRLSSMLRVGQHRIDCVPDRGWPKLVLHFQAEVTYRRQLFTLPKHLLGMPQLQKAMKHHHLLEWLQRVTLPTSSGDRTACSYSTGSVGSCNSKEKTIDGNCTRNSQPSVFDTQTTVTHTLLSDVGKDVWAVANDSTGISNPDAKFSYSVDQDLVYQCLEMTLRKKLGGVKSGEHGGHLTGPLLPIQRSPNVVVSVGRWALSWKRECGEVIDRCVYGVGRRWGGGGKITPPRRYMFPTICACGKCLSFKAFEGRYKGTRQRESERDKKRSEREDNTSPRLLLWVTTSPIARGSSKAEWQTRSPDVFGKQDITQRAKWHLKVKMPTSLVPVVAGATLKRLKSCITRKHKMERTKHCRASVIKDDIFYLSKVKMYGSDKGGHGTHITHYITSTLNLHTKEVHSPPPAVPGWKEVRIRKEAHVQRLNARLHCRWDPSVPHVLSNTVVSMERHQKKGTGETGGPEKICQPATSSGTIPTCKNLGAASLGMEHDSPSQYDVGPTLALMTACTYASILSMRRQMISWGMAAYSLWSTEMRRDINAGQCGLLRVRVTKQKHPKDVLLYSNQDFATLMLLTPCEVAFGICLCDVWRIDSCSPIETKFLHLTPNSHGAWSNQARRCHANFGNMIWSSAEQDDAGSSIHTDSAKTYLQNFSQGCQLL
ncbi:hypothetical protein PR048_001163 [Dryococelus australis]|uniref:Uncharacterized protein n=1 Tax=Dryococelus australis TaxID=614101 RepID=A0ABQ9II27_9NEOP|nr:hypothetical protein PR048_001163 [Dryococelus australis]